MKTPIVRQHDEKDCGAACLSMIAEYWKLKLSLVKCRQLIQVDNNGANLYALIQGAKDIGFDAEALEGAEQELKTEIQKGAISFPFIARIITENMFEHYVVVYGIRNGKVIIGDPAKGKVKHKEDYFFKLWTGHIVTFTKNASFKKGNERRGSFSKFTRLITCQKKLIVWVALISFFISFVSLAGSLVFEHIVNQIVYSGQNASGASQIFDAIFSSIESVCIAIAILYVFQGGVQVLRSYLLAKMSQNMDLPLTTNFFKHLIHLPIAFFGTRKSGEIMSRFENISSIREAISGTILTLIVNSVMAIFFGAYLCSISVPLFLIALGVMVLYTIIVYGFRKPIREINQQNMENDSMMVSHLKESIDGIETIKAFGNENSATEKTVSLFSKLLRLGMKGSLIYSIKDALIEAIASIGVVFLLWMGYNLCNEGIIAIGSLVTFYLVLNYFLNPLQSLIELQPTIQTAIVAAERLNDILDQPVEQENENNDKLSLKGDISIKDVTFRYGYRHPIIKNLTCHIPQGSKVAIVGESGSGKSTLMKLLMAFYMPEQGEITIGNTSLSTCNPKAVRDRIAYVSQNVFFFSDTVKNNLAMNNVAISDEDIEKACQAAMADEFIHELPMGYETVLSENATNLSGGQRQRLSIARALLRQPDILILDEATSNLDTITEQSIKNTVFNISSDITIFIIAHRLNTIRNCDMIFVMDDGRLVESGTHDELMCLNGRYKAYYESNS